MHTILLFGAGKSATVLIDYLLKEAETNNWQIIIADANRQLIEEKTKKHPRSAAIAIDINDETARHELIKKANLVISMMPPQLHILIAKDCIEYGKHLLTASYVDDETRKLDAAAKEKGVLFLCEMGLDPGIDHMSAMKLFDGIREKGGTITSFKSHCGGLVAPESDDNPWHYKISWNPRNILLAGKAGAVYKENGKEISEKYEDLFNAGRGVDTGNEEIGFLSYYPNRNSLSYIDLYNLHEAATFMRTTLRHPDFMYGWNNVIELKLTDETPAYETDGKTLQQFFQEHMQKYGFGEWVNEKLSASLTQSKLMLEKLMEMMEAEEEAEEEGEEVPDSFMMVNEKGALQNVELDEVKNKAAAAVAAQMHTANLTLKQLFYLGMSDNETLINKGFCSAADITQLCLEKKLALNPDDKDMIVMLHEIDYTLNGEKKSVTATLIVKGEDALRTAMAKTVGLPLGIAAKLILNGQLKMSGVHIPVAKEIYEPLLPELEKRGISFKEIYT
ncbi:MAG: saccharopine dehydrogenase C-terminal domain-containing protein [Ferruginibacter sp.]